MASTHTAVDEAQRSHDDHPHPKCPGLGHILLALVGVVLVVVAVVYFTKSAGSLPSFLPGHQAGSAHKHGIAALLVGLIAIGGAWLSSGTKNAPSNT